MKRHPVRPCSCGPSNPDRLAGEDTLHLTRPKADSQVLPVEGVEGALRHFQDVHIPGVIDIRVGNRRPERWPGQTVGARPPRRTKISETELRQLADSPRWQSRGHQVWIEFDIRSRSISIVETDVSRTNSASRLHSLYFDSAVRQARAAKWFNFPCNFAYPGSFVAVTPGSEISLRYCDKNTPEPDPTQPDCPEPDEPTSNCRRSKCLKKLTYGPDGRCRLGFCDGYKPRDYPYSAIGKVNLFASGTLIGKSTILCAAHSVGLVGGLGVGGVFAWFQNFFNVGGWSVNFAARVDASQKGGPIFPFGIANVYALWVPLGFFLTGAPAPGSPNVQSWMQSDVCIAVLDKPVGDLAGFIPAGPTSDILNLPLRFYSIGYPNCDGPFDPFGDGTVDDPQRPPCCPYIYPLGSLKYLPSVVPGVGPNKSYYDNSIMWGAVGQPIKAFFPTSPGSKYFGLIKTDIPASFGQSGQALLVRDHPRGNGAPVATAVFDYIMYPGSDSDPEPAEARYLYTYFAAITPSMAENIALFVAIYDPATFLV